jgi:excisionase family DNA binding protein
MTASGRFEVLWTAEDVAAYLKASRSWVYQKAEAGVLPSLRVCGLLRFEPATVRQFARHTAARTAVVPLTNR